jgi:deoxyribodipyrimidine photolyase-like uncharacterized protein
MIKNDHPTQRRADMADVTDTTEAEVDETEAPTTFAPKDVAEKLGIDAKSFRRWLRRQTADRAGKGGRWVFDAETVEALVAAYNKPADDEVEADEEPEDEELNDELDELDES